MAHECDDCGEAFETLTRLRLHDCGDVQSETPSASSDSNRSDPGYSSPTEERNASVAELDTLLDRFSDGDIDALHYAVVEFESALSAALEEDNSGDTYRDVFWPYHERVSDALDEAGRSEGWTFLEDVIDAYDPAADDEIPLVTPTVANAVGRNLIRTRLTESVETIPVAGLEYLDTIAVSAPDTADTAREEVHTYGWGIGHPDHSVADRLRARASEDIFSVNPTLEHAFYADQYAAVDLLEELVRDESIDGTLPRVTRDDMPYRRYLLDCVYGLQTDDHWPGMPRYYDWHEEFDYTFELDETVEQRIRDLVEETGFDANLPNDWTFRDLGV
jgi:predicted  nucleic acid-binding Zn-ribbon protein